MTHKQSNLDLIHLFFQAYAKNDLETIGNILSPEI